jgi:hypothetical protein
VTVNLDYEAWRCPSRDTFDGDGGRSVFCPSEGCPKSEGCARDRMPPDLNLEA